MPDPRRGGAAVMTSPALDEAWIRAVLFDHGVDDWVDLGPDPIRRRHVGQIYADHVGAAWAAWKWLSDEAGTDPDVPPAGRAAPEALALEIGAADWTELMVALLTVGRAQGLLFADLARGGDSAGAGDAARRAFDRVGRDFAGHAALAFLELRRGTFVDGDRVRGELGRFVPATTALLAGTAVATSWQERLHPLAADLGVDLAEL